MKQERSKTGLSAFMPTARSDHQILGDKRLMSIIRSGLASTRTNLAQNLAERDKRVNKDKRDLC